MEQNIKTVVVFNENGTVDTAFNISENSISDFMARSRSYDESYDEQVDAEYFNLENKYLKEWSEFNSGKEAIATITDEDFGEVEVYWNKDEHTIIADGLTINNVPDTFNKEKISWAWEFFKVVYPTFGVVSFNYDDIDKPELQETIEKYSI